MAQQMIGTKVNTYFSNNPNSSENRAPSTLKHPKSNKRRKEDHTMSESFVDADGESILKKKLTQRRKVTSPFKNLTSTPISSPKAKPRILSPQKTPHK